MADMGASVEKDATAPDPEDPGKVESMADIEGASWGYALKQAIGQFGRDKCTDLAAGLTYYGVLSIFPALLAMVSLLGVFGQGEETVQTILQMVRDLGQSSVADQIEGPIRDMVTSSGAGVGLVVGVVGALWSASGYVGAFGRAMNRIYGVDEGRPVWKLRPAMLLLTLLLVVMGGLIIVGLGVSGGIAEEIGSLIGLGDTAVTVWEYAKWPVMIVLVMVMVALLYYFTPNVRQPKLRWMSPGAALAIIVAILASVAFGFYVSNFGSYNATYGSLAGVIVFLLWLWIINNVLLLGAEVDAEVERARQLQSGIRAERRLQLPARDTAASEKAAEKEDEAIEEGRRIRLEADREIAAERRERSRTDADADADERTDAADEDGSTRSDARD
ncbi:YihY/virulence factor BrkB family protein [Janibacter alkaliphilus]|nr:YihY/virulence factor BrkB family protein [Janibacter alkaliphilus]